MIKKEIGESERLEAERAHERLQQFNDALVSYHDADELTAESGLQAAERLKGFTRELAKPREAQAMLQFYRGETGMVDEAAAVYVAREHGGKPQAARFLAALTAAGGSDVVAAIEAMIADFLKSADPAAALVADADVSTENGDAEAPAPSLFEEPTTPAGHE